jgi:hypothetical protein
MAGPEPGGVPAVDDGRPQVGRLVGAELGVVALILLVTLPVDSPAWVGVSIGSQLAAVLVFLAIAARLHRRVRSVWWTLWVYVALTVSGNVVYDVYQYHLGLEPFVIWRILLLLSTVQRQSARLAELSRTDALTGLPNRRS